MTDIQKQMMATFLSLRVGVGVIGIVFPLLLWGGGTIAGFHLADSMSAYYHANRDCIDPKRTEPRKLFVDWLSSHVCQKPRWQT
jgi:hypothetical protein